MRIPVIWPRIPFVPFVVSLLFPFVLSFDSYSHSLLSFIPIRPCRFIPIPIRTCHLFPSVHVDSFLLPFAPVVYSHSSLSFHFYSHSSMSFHSYSHSYLSLIPICPCRFIPIPIRTCHLFPSVQVDSFLLPFAPVVYSHSSLSNKFYLKSKYL